MAKPITAGALLRALHSPVCWHPIVTGGFALKAIGTSRRDCAHRSIALGYSTLFLAYLKLTLSRGVTLRLFDSTNIVLHLQQQSVVVVRVVLPVAPVRGQLINTAC